MSVSSAEKAVRIARRRKKHALPGSKNRRLFELQEAVTAALAASNATGGGSSLAPRREDKSQHNHPSND